jgi:hypothetical protein
MGKQRFDPAGDSATDAQRASYRSRLGSWLGSWMKAQVTAAVNPKQRLKRLKTPIYDAHTRTRRRTPMSSYTRALSRFSRCFSAQAALSWGFSSATESDPSRPQ